MNYDKNTLYTEALEACDLAYAPYSNIAVGAVALLETGEVVAASNYENCSSPVCICAEHSLVTTLNNIRNGVKIVAIAIAAKYKGAQIDITPCGKCRQVLLECANRQESVIAVYFRYEGSLSVSSSHKLLPYSFDLSLG